MLIALLQRTILHLPLSQSDHPLCSNTAPDGPPGGFYNNANGRIEVCIGALETLDSTSDSDLALTFAHELGHSIDPCALEHFASSKGKPDPEIALKTYPGLLQCLRGGKGQDGCKDSVLHCTSEKGMDEYCSATGAKQGSSQFNACMASLHETPSCSDYSAPNAGKSRELSYRTRGMPSDQIQESFADYIGSETEGALLLDHQLEGPLSDQERLDAFVSDVTDFDQLHGGCIEHNTKDAHPPAFIRINRVFMSSPRFRQGMGCTNGPPRTTDAGVSCPSF
jgi:hypothetical protein